MKSFHHQFRFEKTAFPETKVEVMKPDLKRIYLHMVPD